jgi:hypothetical protein
MTRYMGVAKAAKLLGVSRDNLQQLIRNGDLETFEGRVDVEMLKLRFPALALDESAAVERTQIIRDSAYAKRVQETLYPTKEELQTQIRRLKVELSVARTKARSYHNVFDDLLEQLAGMQQNHDADQRKIANEINEWLLRRINAADTYLARTEDDSSDHGSSK